MLNVRLPAFGFVMAIGSGVLHAAPEPEGPFGQFVQWHGCWTFTGRELNSDGDAFRREGRAQVVVGTDDIRIERRSEVSEATGYYLTIPTQRTLRFQILAQPDGELLLQRRGNQTEGGRPISLSPSGDMRYSQSLFYSSSRGHALASIGRYRMIDADTYIGEESLQDPHGSFREYYVETWTRTREESEDCFAE